jgi:hypothetical protein
MKLALQTRERLTVAAPRATPEDEHNLEGLLAFVPELQEMMARTATERRLTAAAPIPIDRGQTRFGLD